MKEQHGGLELIQVGSATYLTNIKKTMRRRSLNEECLVEICRNASIFHEQKRKSMLIGYSILKQPCSCVFEIAIDRVNVFCFPIEKTVILCQTKYDLLFVIFIFPFSTINLV